MYALNRYLVICLTTILCVSLTNLLFLPDYWEVRVDLSGAKWARYVFVFGFGYSDTCIMHLLLRPLVPEVSWVEDKTWLLMSWLVT